MAEKGQADTVNDPTDGTYQILKQKLRIANSRARVTQIVDGETLIINNSETLHLPMIYIPTGQQGGENAMAAAKAYLEDMVAGDFITVFQVRNNERALQNALGHTEAYVMSDGVFIQADMVRRGLAFAYPSPSHHAVTELLYQAEAEARENEQGLWALPEWQIMTEEDVKTHDNRFVIVEGRVEKVATRKNVIYLNFEQDWKQDFTVAIASDLRRDFSRANKSPMQLGGKAVRVRGWIRDYNGPYMEVLHPSQIEIIRTPKAEQQKMQEDARDVSGDKDTENESLFARWGLDGIRDNNIAPKSPIENEEWGTSRPYAAQPLKPVVPMQPLTSQPAQARSPAQEVPKGVIDAQTPTNDWMDRGLLDQDVGPGEDK